VGVAVSLTGNLQLRLDARALSRLLTVVKEMSNAAQRRAFRNAMALRAVELAAEAARDRDVLLAAAAWSECAGCALSAAERAEGAAARAALGDALRTAKRLRAGPTLPTYDGFEVRFLLLIVVTLNAIRAHDLTRSPSHL
jgi:hypothetical protein